MGKAHLHEGQLHLYRMLGRMDLFVGHAVIVRFDEGGRGLPVDLDYPEGVRKPRPVKTDIFWK